MVAASVQLCKSTRGKASNGQKLTGRLVRVCLRLKPDSTEAEMTAKVTALSAAKGDSPVARVRRVRQISGKRTIRRSAICAGGQT